MSNLSNIVTQLGNMAKRVFVKRYRRYARWGILAPGATIKETVDSEQFIDARDELVLRDVQFHCAFQEHLLGCAGFYTGAAEGTPEPETPPSTRPRVTLGFNSTTGRFYRQDTLETVTIAKRLYLKANGSNEAELL